MSEELSAAAVTDAMTTVRELVRADGGDVLLEAAAGSAVTLRLVLDGAECRECVMPRPFLEQVALDSMSSSLPTLTAVTIIDPRET